MTLIFHAFVKIYNNSASNISAFNTLSCISTLFSNIVASIIFFSLFCFRISFIISWVFSVSVFLIIFIHFYFSPSLCLASVFIIRLGLVFAPSPFLFRFVYFSSYAHIRFWFRRYFSLLFFVYVFAFVLVFVSIFDSFL